MSSRLKELLAKTDALEESIDDLHWREYEIRKEIRKQKEERDRVEA